MRQFFSSPARIPVRFLVVLGIIAALLLSAGWGWEVYAAPTLPSMPDPRPTDRIMVLAPHPDDETLGCGGLIRRAVERGADVRVVVFTSGDAFSIIAHRLYPKEPFTPALFKKLGETRIRETRQAMARLGLPSSRMTFLGYPDGGLEQLWTTNWKRPLKAYRTRTTRSPYRRDGLPPAVYSGESLLNDLEYLLKTYRPNTVVFPHPGDFNRDHRSASAFTMMALNRLKGRAGWAAPREATYVVHWGKGWPWPPVALTTAPVRLPAALLRPQEQWQTLSLDRDTALRKRAAITDYRSQYASLYVARFLNSFARQTEAFSVKERSRPLSAGTSLYEPVGSAHSDAFTDASDVTRVRVSADRSHLEIRFTLREPLTPDLLCRLDLRTLEPFGGTRWLADIWKLNDPPARPLGVCSVTEKAVVWRVPRTKLGDAQAVLVSVGTGKGRKESDRSAWALWSIPPIKTKGPLLGSRPHPRRRG